MKYICIFQSTFKAIRRLSMDDAQFVQDVCNVMNKVYMKGENLQKTDEEFKLSQNETDRLEQPDLINGNYNIAFLEIYS